MIKKIEIMSIKARAIRSANKFGKYIYSDRTYNNCKDYP